VAYESGELRGRKLLAARRLIEVRGLFGKASGRIGSNCLAPKVIKVPPPRAPAGVIGPLTKQSPAGIFCMR